MIKIKISKDSGEPLYVQIRNTIENAIKKGDLKPGDQLPAVTTLASDIGLILLCAGHLRTYLRRVFSDPM